MHGWASSPKCSHITPSTTCAGWRSASARARAGPTRSRPSRDAGVRSPSGPTGRARTRVVHGEPVPGIYAAVTRQTLDGKPEGGWFPEERLDLETACALHGEQRVGRGRGATQGAYRRGSARRPRGAGSRPFAVPPARLKECDRWSIQSSADASCTLPANHSPEKRHRVRRRRSLWRWRCFTAYLYG